MPRWWKKAKHGDESGPSRATRSKRRHDPTPPPSSSSEADEHEYEEEEHESEEQEHAFVEEGDASLSEEEVSSSPEDSPTDDPMGEDEEAPRFDNYRFRNQGRQEEFYEHWSRKSVLCERGIRLSHFPALQEIIENRGWVRAMTFRASADPMLVREFYANVKIYAPDEGERQLLCRVRGRRFRLKVSTIATFLDIPTVDDPGYPFPEDSCPSRDELAATLSDLTQRNRGYVPQFPKKKLSPFYRVLHELSCSQIFPLVHDDLVSQQRALLLFAIATDVPIDLATIIFDTIIQRAVNPSARSVLPFGGLITCILEQFGVIVENTARTILPSVMISEATGARRAAQLRLREITSPMPASASSAPGPSTSTAPSVATSSEHPPPTVLNRDMLHRIDLRLQTVETEIPIMRGSLARIEAQLASQGTTMDSILEAFRAMGPTPHPHPPSYDPSERPPSP